MYFAVLPHLLDEDELEEHSLGWERIDRFHEATLEAKSPADGATSPAASRFLLGLKLADRRLDRVEELLLDGDKWTYALIGGFEDTGGPFRVQRLAGIELLTRLRALRFGGMVDRVDLTPLAKLPRLETFSCAANEVRSLRPLLVCTALRRVSVTNLSDTGEALEVLRALAARGVEVAVQGSAAAAFKGAGKQSGQPQTKKRSKR